MSGITITKSIAKKILEQAGKKVKAAEAGEKLTPRGDLLSETVKKKQVKIKDNTTTAVLPDGTSVQINKKDFKTKVPKPDKRADETLEGLKLEMLDNKIGRSILSDFNIDNIQNADDIAKYIEAISLKFAKEFDKRKRGIQTNKVTKQLATLLNKDQATLTANLLNLQPGSTLNAETIFAARELLVAGMGKLDELALAAQRGGTTEVVAFRQHFALMSELQKVIKGVQTETARALQQFRIKTREVGYQNIELDKLKEDTLVVELGGAGGSQNLATAYLSLKRADQKLKFAEDTGVYKNISKFADGISEAYINIILSNPLTHVRNTAGNFLSLAIVDTERFIASRFLRGIGGPDGMEVYEDVAKVFGQKMVAQEMLGAIGDSMSNAFKGKFNAADIKPIFKTSKLDNQHNNYSAGNSFLGRLVTLDRLPTRFLTFSDNFFKNIEYRGELYALGFREASKRMKAGDLTQDQAADFIADFVVNPSAKATKEAYDAAHYVTFQTNNRNDFFGNINKGGQYIKKQSGWFQWFVNQYLPFVRTPTNIAGFVAERTPGMNLLLKSFYDDMAAGGARRQNAIAKLSLGSAFYTTFGTIGYMSDTFEGSQQEYKTDRNTKKELKKLGNIQSKSIKFDSYSLSLQGYDPVAQMFGMAADMGKLAHYIGDDPKEWQSYTNFALGTVLSFGENLMNSTYLQGATNLAKDYTFFQMAKDSGDPSKFYKNYFSRFASSYVPTGARQIGKWLHGDPYQKITKEFNEHLFRNLTEKNTYIEFDVVGNPNYEFSAKGKRKKGPVIDELLRVKAKIPKWNYYFSYSAPGQLGTIETLYPQNIEMTSQERSMLQELSGNLALNGNFEVSIDNPLYAVTKKGVADGFTKMFESEYYKAMPDALKAKMITGTISASRSKAKELLKKDPTIKKRINNIGLKGMTDDLRNDQLIQ